MTPALALAIVAFLIACNALFVAAEFALVAASRGAIGELADAGNRRAERVDGQLSNLSFILSACQFGITATSLLVGFLAEDAIGDVLVRPVVELLGLPDATATGISIGAALLLSTIIQMVIGELAPKNLAIARPTETSMATSRPLAVFTTLFGPIIRLFDHAAAALTRRLFRVEVTHELGGGLSMDEFARIIEASGQEGMLSDSQARILTRAVTLRDRRVDEVMIPRVDVTWVQADQPVASLREVARDSGHSRFPVRDGEQVVGTVHVKDLMAVPVDRHTTTSMADIAAPTMLVSESEQARGLLTRFRSEGRTFGVVVDEYGDVTGVVTMEDVLEQLVGRIEDEHDSDEPPAASRLADGSIQVPGRMTVDMARDVLGVQLPDGDYDTVAGLVIELVGRIPEVGDSAAWEGTEFRVASMAGPRIDEVVLTTAAAGDDAGDEVPVDVQSDPDGSVAPVDDHPGTRGSAHG